LRARDQAIAERDRHAAELDQLRRQSNQRGAAMVMRSAAIDRARGGQRESRALALAIGGVCLLIVVLIAALLFGLH
jgi:Flp pilus assembly protein TadB